MPKSISISKVDGKPGQVYVRPSVSHHPHHPLTQQKCPLVLNEVPKPTPQPNELVLQIHAAALNHRDLFIRQHLYPGIEFGIPLLADGCGTVVSTGSSPSAKSWQGKRVVINPGTGWKDSLEGPESPRGYAILGGTKHNPNGTLQEYMVVSADEVEEAPAHLSDAEAAAWPLTGLTAWRAVMVKCGEQNLRPGKNVLITGIGGGVALCALEFARAAGANVWVTSGNQEKIDKAVKLGARGGVSYKEKDWDRKLAGMLPESNKFLDAIVDGAGSDVVSKGARLLKVSLSQAASLGLELMANYSW
jgi:NADPH:quinone reductase-like Zn-dependent oxidoreductase